MAHDENGYGMHPAGEAAVGTGRGSSRTATHLDDIADAFAGCAGMLALAVMAELVPETADGSPD